jgi:hypothetical protein
MRLTELPASWEPGDPLEIVAHIRCALSVLGDNGRFAVHADRDDFSSLQVAHLAVDDVPVVLLAHDPAPDYVYVYLPKGMVGRDRILSELFEALEVERGDIAWSLPPEA